MIRHTLTDCPLGRLLLAANAEGVCALYLGDADDELRAALGGASPALRDDAGLRPWAEEIVRHLRGGPTPGVPLGVPGSEFQWRVWRELRAIPAGSTRSYAEVAGRLGRPTAARAVARACATNPVSLLIPCHRVVRGDGSLGGYRWGLHRKRALLDLERRRAGEFS